MLILGWIWREVGGNRRLLGGGGESPAVKGAKFTGAEAVDVDENLKV
jgi:hypothetical protein